MRINWLRVLQRGAWMLTFCVVIAAFDTLIWPWIRYVFLLVYTLCITIPAWLVTELGRLLVRQEHCRYSVEDGDHGWPAGWRGVVLSAVSIMVGFLGGYPLAAWMLDDPLLIMPEREVPLILLLLIASSIAINFFFNARRAQAALQAEAVAAERHAAEARLKLLATQLEPHMLFNTLANMRALITKDPAAARQMLDRLDGFLRASLDASRATTHLLADEFERLRDYLALMSIRMGPRLTWALHLPDELRTQLVPPLLLQPLVENAIRHGLEPRREGGHIEVSAARNSQQLVLTVRDTGVGFDPGARPSVAGKQFGLAQILERVATAYKGEGRVEVQSQPGNGTTISITLPCPTLP